MSGEPLGAEPKQLAALVSGKGLWVWYASRPGDPEAAAQRAREVGLSWVCLKSADGPELWTSEFSRERVEVFKAAGIHVYSWQYVYGVDPGQESRAAEWSIQQGSELHVLDIEAEFEGRPERLRRLLEALDLDSARLGYSSFGIQQYHPIDWPQLYARCATAWPQVYWGEFGWPPARSLELAAEGLDGFAGQVIPLGDTYGRVDGPGTAEFAARALARWPAAVGWYSWEAASPAAWEAIAEVSGPWSLVSGRDGAAQPSDSGLGSPDSGLRSGVTRLSDGMWSVSRGWRDRLVSLLGAIGSASYQQPVDAGAIQRMVRQAKTMLDADDYRE